MEKNSENKVLKPELIKTNLMLSSLFITSYELLKNSIINRIKEFLCHEIKVIDKQVVYEKSEEYKKVRKKAKNILEASLIWLVENQVIIEEEKSTIQKISEERDKIAHKLPEILIDENYSIDINLFIESKRLLDKIEKWWIIEVDIPTNPDFDNMNYEDIDWDNIQSGSSLMFEWVVKCAFEIKDSE